MPSNDLIDQKTFDLLSGQIRGARLATTYLFTGEEQERKKALAIAFAKAINCETFVKRADDGETCACSTCERIDKGIYPDVKWYGLDEDASSIKIEDARDFKNWLSLKPLEAKVKVFVFNLAERLTDQAQNALLKSLEEPPAGNVIILLVNHALNLFDTIVSRAVEIRVPGFRADTIWQMLTAEGVQPAEAAFLSRLSKGNLGWARDAHARGLYEERKTWLDGLFRDPVSFLDAFHSLKRPAMLALFDFLLEWARDLLVFRASGKSDYLLYADRAYPMERLIGRKHFEEVFALFNEFADMRKSIDENANVKLVLTKAQVTLENFSDG